ncbi:MAG: deoxynucleoside kinase [Pseudohongiellaceae bacterium]|nr:deoxynucleoside kinase [Pseudohongiellaceae bacterium]
MENDNAPLIPQATAPKFIAVEGPIGVGKTSLTRRLAETFNYETLLEKPEENPFLERFYYNPKQNALATQLFFLFQRSRQIQDLRQDDLFQPVRVADFLIDKDMLFARQILDDDEYQLYQQVFNHLTIDAPTPDLVIYLQAPANVLLQRIQKRGIAAERNIQKEYLENLNEAYTNFFYYYDRSPLLIVNSADIDLVDNDEDYAQLVEQILSGMNGTHYFNPKPSLI